MTLVLGRRTLEVRDFDQPLIRVGRLGEMDIVIDNDSVSRLHVELVKTPHGWVARDAGSANGTYVNGERISTDRLLRPGDEISIGKFSLFFDRVVGESERTRGGKQSPRPTSTSQGLVGGTMYIRPADVQRLVESSARKRRAHLTWSVGSDSGTHDLRRKARCSSAAARCAICASAKVPGTICCCPGPERRVEVTPGT